MCRIVLLLLLCVSPAAAQVPGKVIKTLADVPPQLRQPNWNSSRDGRGSCVNASTVTILRFLGLEEHANWWRTNFEGGEWSTSHIRHMLDSGLLFAYTDIGSVEFLDWAARNRLPLGVFYKPNHAINVVDLTTEWAVLLDNNNPGAYEYVPRTEFVSRWQREFEGFGWTFVYYPPPPWPVQ